jgi:hypothetical protein
MTSRVSHSLPGSELNFRVIPGLLLFLDHKPFHALRIRWSQVLQSAIFSRRILEFLMGGRNRCDTSDKGEVRSTIHKVSVDMCYCLTLRIPTLL